MKFLCIDIASDEVTGEQAAKILANELRQTIRDVQIPLEQVYQANEDSINIVYIRYSLH